MNDLISRNALIMHLNDWALSVSDNDKEYEDVQAFIKCVAEWPSAQSKQKRLTDDDIETIRIHLNAIKEELCNQHRWHEAKEYEGIIDRLMKLPSANQWIKCSDRLPQKSGLYLIVSKHITKWVVYLAYYSESKMLFARPDDVISTSRGVYLHHGVEPSLIEAWMPLPQYEDTDD